MAEYGLRDLPLRWDVFVTPAVPVVDNELPPGENQRVWPPISSTLISGERDAVLVDAFVTAAQTRPLVEWVEASGKNLTMLYATHGHGDHFFGATTVLERFAHARFVATPDVVKFMRQQASPQWLASFWNARFPGQMYDHPVIADELAGNLIDLEGHKLLVVPLGHTDTDNTTCLHVPSIELVIAGDAVYNGVHPRLAESNSQGRREWMSALDTIESLQPRTVIAGHKRPENDDSPKTIRETRQYIRDFDRLASATTTTRELYDKMLDLYPDRLNRGALWSSARAAKP